MTTSCRPAFSVGSVMNSLKVPSAATSTRWPFTVTVAPGSVRPFTCRMFAAGLEGGDHEGRRRPAARGRRRLGRVTVKRAKSENGPSTLSLSTAATRQ